MRVSGTGRAPGWWRYARAGVALSAALGLLVVSGTSASAGTRASYVRPLAGTFLTSAGEFTLTGRVNIVLPPNPVIPGNPVLPPNPIRATLENTAATSGAITCRATGTVSHQPAGGEDEISFTGSYRFFPGDPCDPLGDLRVAISITYDEAGNPIAVTAEVIDGEIVT